MDGDINTLTPDSHIVRESAESTRPRPSRTRRVVWFTIVTLLLGLVLGTLYGYDWYRAKMTAAFFATMKPPPAQIVAVKATTASVPQYANGIGSLAAVHHVTVMPEVGGRVTAIDFEAGAHVKAGDQLVQLNDGPDRGDLANYQAQARWSKVSLERAQILAQRQVGSRENVDQTQSQLDQANAQIAKTEAIIAQKQIHAPFSGRLGVRQIEVGQFLSPGAAIVTLTDLKHLYVNFTLPSTQRAEIKLGQKVNVLSDAYPGRKFEAEITTLEPQVKPDSRTMMVQATLANPDEELLPGMFVNAAVVLPADADRVILPETAVEYTLYGDSVYIIREDGKDDSGKPKLKAVRTPVKTGPRWDGKVAILSGVAPGDLVGGAGQVKLQDGSQVIVTENAPPQRPAVATRN